MCNKHYQHVVSNDEKSLALGVWRHAAGSNKGRTASVLNGREEQQVNGHVIELNNLFLTLSLLRREHVWRELSAQTQQQLGWALLNRCSHKPEYQTEHCVPQTDPV